LAPRALEKENSMSVIKSGNFVHDSTIAAAEGVRQVAVAAAGNNQVSVKNAEIAFFRSVRASCISNNNSSGVAQASAALRELGVWS
jgi:hypothetical protein